MPGFFHMSGYRPDTVGHSLSMPHGCCHCAKFSTLLGLQRRPMGSMICGTLGLTNSIRPLSRHTPPSLILALAYAQKLSPSINVELVDGQEVFGQHANGLTS
jgi:hypothetical protein